MAHIPKKKMKLQNVLILVLIAFILVNIGISEIIKRVQVGAETAVAPAVTPATFQGSATWRSNCIKEADKGSQTVNYTNSPAKVSIHGSNPKVGSDGKTTATITIGTDFNSAWKETTVESWTRETTIDEIKPVPTNDVNIGSDSTHIVSAQLAPQAEASYRGAITICWKVKDAPASVISTTQNSYFKTFAYTDNVRIIRPADATAPPTIEESTRGTADASGVEPDPSAGDSACAIKCTKNVAFWNLTGAMQNALCAMQCNMINWMTEFMTWLIKVMLLPSLGITPPAT